MRRRRGRTAPRSHLNVAGLRRSDSSYEIYKRLDPHYFDKCTLRHDLVIGAKTLKVTASTRNVGG